MKPITSKNKLIFPSLNNRPAGISEDEQAFWDSDIGTQSVLTAAWQWKSGPGLHYLFKALWKSKILGPALKAVVCFTLTFVAFSAFALTIICRAKS